jgi:hypothetical protein
MRLQLKPLPLIAFFILVLLLHELHESAHYFAGWLACGCPGDRDFLVWKLCRTCTAQSTFLVASFAGPLVTYAFMWWGFYLMRPASAVHQKTIGFALTLAALPLPRWLAALDKGGDEISTLRHVFSTSQSYKAVLIGGFIVLLFTVPPAWRAFRTIKNRLAILIMLAFLAIPWLLDSWLVERYLNKTLAASGLWMEPLYGGVPVIVTAWQLILIGAFLLTCRQLKNLSTEGALGN